MHEKSVLLPLLPATLLALEEPGVLQCLVPYAVISMFPLLRRDDLVLPYFALLALFFLLPKCPARAEAARGTPFKWLNSSILKMCSIIGAVILHFLYLFVQPPSRYPFLFEAFLTSYSFAHFVVLVIYTNYKQWFVPADDQWMSSSKKSNWPEALQLSFYGVLTSTSCQILHSIWFCTRIQWTDQNTCRRTSSSSGGIIHLQAATATRL